MCSFMGTSSFLYRQHPTPAGLTKRNQYRALNLQIVNQTSTFYFRVDIADNDRKITNI